MTLDLRMLRAFCEVARLRSFSSAAQHQGVSQAAVSKSIRRLESLFHASAVLAEP
jgi:DNA-binding transcriptional LysR family regulator